MQLQERKGAEEKKNKITKDRWRTDINPQSTIKTNVAGQPFPCTLIKITSWCL